MRGKCLSFLKNKEFFQFYFLKILVYICVMEFTQHVNFIDCFDLEAADTFYSGVIGLPIAYSQAG